MSPWFLILNQTITSVSGKVTVKLTSTLCRAGPFAVTNYCASSELVPRALKIAQ